MATATTAPESAMLALEKRMSDPAVADALNRLLDRLDSVAFFVESMDGFVRRGETIIDSITSTVDELRQAQTGESQQLFEKAPQWFKTGTQLADAAGAMNVSQLSQSRLLERLTDAGTLDALNRLLDQLPLIAFLTQALKDFLERGETVADNLAGVVQELHLKEMDPAKVVRLMESLPKLQEAGEKLLNSDLLGDNLHRLMDAGTGVLSSGLLDPKVIAPLAKVTQKAAEALDEASRAEIKPIGGLFAMLRAMKDPDVQKSIGFAVNFAKAFSKKI